MKKWQIFENEVFEELSEIFSSANTTFQKAGNSDSTQSDVEVKNTKQESNFYLEIKMPKSQSGQFVLELENNKYSFSKNMKYSADQFQKEIINIINHFNGNLKDLKVDQSILSRAVQSHYQRKNTKFIITKKKNSSELIFIPLNKLLDFFDVSIKVRKKPSGSQPVSKKFYNFIDLEIKQLAPELELTYQDNKMFIKGTVLKPYLISGFYFSKINDDFHEVKKRSNTNNLTVLYSLTLKATHPMSFTNDFVEMIKKG